MTTKTKPATAPYPIRDVELAQIIPNPKNIRHTVTGVDELAASIKELGVLSNLVVAPDSAPGVSEADVHYVLIAGHRRYAAAEKAGLTVVPCLIRTDLTDEAAQIQAMLDENQQRSNLNEVEEGDAFQGLLDFGLSSAEVAKRNNISTPYLRNRIKVAKAPEAVRTKVITAAADFEDALAVEKYKSRPALYEELTAALGTDRFKFALKRAVEIVGREKAMKDAAKRQKVTIEQLKAEGIRLLLTGGERDDYLAAYEKKHPGIDVRWESLNCRPDAPDSDEVAAWYNNGPQSLLRWFRIVPDTTNPTPGNTAPSGGQDRPADNDLHARRAADTQQLEDIRTAAKVRRDFLADTIKTGDKNHSRRAAVWSLNYKVKDLDADNLLILGTVLGRVVPDTLPESDHSQYLEDAITRWADSASLESLALANMIVDVADLEYYLGDDLRAWRGVHGWADEIARYQRELDALGYQWTPIEKQLDAERTAADDE
ncbi:MAG: ParB/RepB/Spo0J family partition protein [Rhodococcus sp. (in: high G+C Gram-positive bacteria)]|uniref:ParB/RepB/Spo0J family partition protein n=1 Tax=Rhodococcus sp. TaxID=1831 RepID=UPI002ADA1C80|nr:ParB/RepB/Spo0J family partition protein [Rhodococcus sp. (in: high G+C Gram-positive bacteria)]